MSEERKGTPAQPQPQGPVHAHSPDKRVGEMLLAAEVIDEQQLNQALDYQAKNGGKLFEVLIELKSLSKEALHSFLSQQSGVPSIDLSKYHIPRELVSIIPEDLARENVVLPIDKLGKLLTVGMACPLDTVTISKLESITGLRVKAMLCKLDDIKALIKRYYPTDVDITYVGPALEVAPRTEPKPEKAKPKIPKPEPPAEKEVPSPVPVVEARKEPEKPKVRRVSASQVVMRIEEQDDLPPHPSLLKQAQTVAAEPGKPLRDIVSLVNRDPCLTARVMHVANSAPYGMPGRASSIQMAAALLGAQALGTILQSFGQPSADAKFDKGYRSLWLRSAFCANAAMSIAKATAKENPSDACTAGLLHDIGRVLLPAAFPEFYAQIDPQMAILDLLHLEEEIFGIAHPEVGYLLARRWQLPPVVAHAIRFHHYPDAAEAEDLIAIVALAAVMAEAFERRCPPGVECFVGCGDLLKHLEMDESAAVCIFENAGCAFAASAEKASAEKASGEKK